MKRALLLAAVLVLPCVASAQRNVWSYAGAFPADSLKATTSGHGVAVDPDGKVWLQPFGGTTSITFPDTVLIYNGPTAAPLKRKTVTVQQIFVYNANGTPAAFSPITYLSNAAGTVTDTLGYVQRGRDAASGRPIADTRSGRGLRVGPDGNIYVSQVTDLFRLNYKTGAVMGKVRGVYGLEGAEAITAPAVDGQGNVYIAAVIQAAGRPIKTYSQDLSTVLDASTIAAPNGFSRSFEVSRDGLKIYWAGYTTHAIHVYKRGSDLDPFVQTPDTVLKGFDSESLTIHPVNGALWASAGSDNDKPNRYVGFRAPYTYQIQTWYAFDQTQLSATNPNPTPLDSIKWVGGGIGRPRGLAFDPAGTVAYATQFSGTIPAFQKFVFGPSNAAEPTEALPAGVAVRAFPNPTAGDARIAFTVARAGAVKLKVYDVLGREVAALVDETLAPGSYSATFDGASLPAGAYLYRLQADGRAVSGTLTVSK